MSEVGFIFEGQSIIIQSKENQIMRDICNNFCGKINANLDSLIFLYGGKILNIDKKLIEITKEDKIKILVLKADNQKCSNCGRILNDKTIDEIINSNNKINYTLYGLQSQIESIINDMTNKKDINYINSQLKNVNKIINILYGDIKKINKKLNNIKFNGIQDDSLNKNTINDNDNDNLMKKNEIICFYNKKSNEIDLLHGYNLDIAEFSDENKKSYLEAKDNINGNNIEYLY